MSTILKRSSSENIAGIKKPKSSEVLAMSKTDVALARWGELLDDWRAGKFYDPETADAANSSFFAKNCVVDATHGCAGLHSTFKVYGYADLKDYWAMVSELNFEGLKINFVASPQTEGEVWEHFEAEEVTHKITGKKVQNTAGLCIVSFDGARISRLRLLFQSPSALAALSSTDDVPIPPRVMLPSFEPAADPKAVFDAMFARWGAGEFNHAETKQAALEEHAVADCVVDCSSPAMPSLLKVYTGHEGLDAWSCGVVGEQWEMSNLDVAVASGVKAGCVLIKMVFDVKHRATRKEATGVTAYQEHAYNAEGKYVFTRWFWVNPEALAAIHSPSREAKDEWVFGAAIHSPSREAKDEWVFGAAIHSPSREAKDEWVFGGGPEATEAKNEWVF